jgi:RND superfamily putative drug exporter
MGRACHDHRWRVVFAWLAILVVLAVAMGAKGSGYTSKFSLPDVESQHGFDLLEEDFGGAGAGITGSIVFKADQGVADPAVKAAMEKLFTEIGQLPPPLPTVRVSSPYAPGPEPRIALQGPDAGKIAYAELELPPTVDAAQAIDVRKAIDERLPEVDGLQIEIGGAIFASFEPPNSEALGLAFAVVILIIAFGSVMAMGLPVGTALSGIVAGAAITGLISNIVEMPEFTSFIALMIGLGVGIDYALFIVTRYREELHAGRDEADAVAVAINTAGRAVLFAGTTVVISLLGLLIMGLAFVNGLAIGSAIVVAATMLASVTLLPALLSLVGQRVELTRWRGLIAAGFVAVALLGAGLKLGLLSQVALGLALVVFLLGTRIFWVLKFIWPKSRLAQFTVISALRREVPHRHRPPMERTFAYRWSRLIQRRAWPAVIFGVLVLVLLAIPVISLRLAFSDEGNYEESTTTRQAYDLLAEGFGPGHNGKILLVTAAPAGTDAAAIQRVTDAVQADPGVAFIPPAIPNSPTAPTAYLWTVIPTTSPQAVETTDLVNRLRSEVLPAATAGTGLDVLATGSVGVNVDFSDYLAQRLPWFLGAVLTLSFLLLMAVFRSILVPLKAVIMNLLAMAAAYGCIVAVFQWGWLAPVFQVQAAGPIEPFIPMMLFAIVFGLSMDYEVFLLSRVKEEYDSGKPNDQAVADGLASTARVITAAAAIMVFVFGSFLLEADRVIKLMGFGLAIAVLLDATLVRMVLVPATMELLGDKNWWIPKWLDRILPRIDVEGEHHPPLPIDSDSESSGGEDDKELQPVG